MVDAPDEIRKAFRNAWRGLQAYQNHIDDKKVGDLTMSAYKDVQKNFGTAICFDRECSPVAHAMNDHEECAGASEKHIKKPKKRSGMPNKKGGKGVTAL
jgi:hypothetical protein